MRRLSLALAFMASMYASNGLAESSSLNSDDILLQRYHDLTLVLRCPKCQNQNIAESGSPIAEDLRFEINRMLKAGKSNEQIIDFMVGRYGEYVLYDPKFSSKTLPLYLGPVAMMLSGGLAVAAIVSVKRRDRSKGERLLSEEEQIRLNSLLNDAAQSSEKQS